MTKTRNIADLLDANGDVVAGALGNVPASDLTNLSASNLTSGTVPDARFPATLPALNGSALTTLNASNLTSGTLPDARFPATLPSVSGANLTNIPASSDFVKIATTTASGASTVDFSGLFTATYENYMLISSNVYLSSPDGIALRVQIGGSYISSNTYFSPQFYAYVNGSTENTNAGVDWGYTRYRMSTTSISGDSGYPSSFRTMFYSPRIATRTNIHSDTMVNNANFTQLIFGQSGCVHNSASVVTGFQLVPEGGTIYGTFSLYGIKK